MVISATSTMSTPAAASTSGAEGSRYTAIVDRYVKILEGGGASSFDEQIEALQGSMKLLWGVDENGEGGILYRENKKDTERLSSSLMSSDVIKKVWAAESRYAQVHKMLEPEAIKREENGEGRCPEQEVLSIFSKISIEDQKLFFAACRNRSTDARISTKEFASLDDYKTFLRQKADAFARQQASLPAGGAPSSAAPEEVTASGKVDSSKSKKATNADKPQGVVTLVAKPGLPPAPTATLNAAVALQVLQAASEASKASTAANPAHSFQNQIGHGNTTGSPRAPELSVKLRV